jgi:hypothetical protein
MGGHRLGCAVLIRVPPAVRRRHQRRGPSCRGAEGRPLPPDPDTGDARPAGPGRRSVLEGPDQPLHDHRGAGHEARRRVRLRREGAVKRHRCGRLRVDELEERAKPIRLGVAGPHRTARRRRIIRRTGEGAKGMSMKDRFALLARWMPWLESRYEAKRPRYLLLGSCGEPRELAHFAEKSTLRRQRRQHWAMPTVEPPAPTHPDQRSGCESGVREWAW